MLKDQPGQGTRLLVRTRANYSPPAIRLLALPFGIFDATYGVAMLRAIARRAEFLDTTARGHRDGGVAGALSHPARRETR